MAITDKPQKHRLSIPRALSKYGYCSRKEAIGLIYDGRVTVNNETVASPKFRFVPDTDVIKIDGKVITGKELRYILLNKPEGYVTTRSDELGRKTVYDLIGDVGQWVFPVGRLDLDSSGLLLFTNDNQLGDWLSNPLVKVPKVYEVKLDEELDAEHRLIMQEGMLLDGQQLQPVEIKPLRKKHTYHFTLVEGKNRQIRRMCWEFGYKVLELTRTEIGNLKIGNLKQGSWRHLEEGEIKELKNSTRLVLMLMHQQHAEEREERARQEALRPKPVMVTRRRTIRTSRLRR